MYTYLTTWPNPATCSTIENDRFPSAGDRSAAVTEASNRKSGALRRSNNQMSAVEGTNGVDNYNDGLWLVISVGDFQK